MGSQEILSGNLHVLKSGLINRSWQSRRCVLFHGSTSGTRLEYFDNQDGSHRQSANKKVVPLEKISRIEKLQPKQNSFPFDITVKSGKLSFMAPNADECERWIQAFTFIMNQEMRLASAPVTQASTDPSSSALMDNVLYESTDLMTKFPVTLVESESEAAKSHGLVGKNYQLAVGRMGYDLFDAAGQNSLHHWPFRIVRKFGATEDHFILIGGSRCEEWAGEYKFLTSEGQAIKSAVDWMTRLLAPNANQPPSSPNEGPPPVKEKPTPQPRRSFNSEGGSAAPKHETSTSSGGRDTVRAPHNAAGTFRGPPADCLAELDDKLYEYTKVRPDLEFRHPKHQDKNQGKVAVQPMTPTPESVAPAAAQAAPSNPSKAPLQPTHSNPPVEANEQKSQSLGRTQSADYDKAQKKKTKEEKKREEKERKEHEKREKEQQEREKKEQEKREKEEKKKKSREKSKPKPSTLSKASAMTAYTDVNTYEEVDVPKPPDQDKQAQAVENEYTEANFRPQPPASQGVIRGHIYSEPDIAPAPASVTQPRPALDVYSQVVKPRIEAWKEFGRPEDNLHEEDYDQIQMAAKEAEQTRFPGVNPATTDEDGTYDSLAISSLHKDKPLTKTDTDTDNIYGMASAVPALSSRLSSAADSESGYEDAEMVNAVASACQRNANYRPSHNYEEPDFGSMASPEEEEEEEDPYTNA